MNTRQYFHLPEVEEAYRLMDSVHTDYLINTLQGKSLSTPTIYDSNPS